MPILEWCKESEKTPIEIEVEGVPEGTRIWWNRDESKKVLVSFPPFYDEGIKERYRCEIFTEGAPDEYVIAEIMMSAEDAHIAILLLIEEEGEPLPWKITVSQNVVNVAKLDKMCPDLLARLRKEESHGRDHG